MKQNRHHHLFHNSNVFIIQYTLLQEQLTMPPQIDNNLFSEDFEAEAVAYDNLLLQKTLTDYTRLPDVSTVVGAVYLTMYCYCDDDNDEEDSNNNKKHSHRYNKVSRLQEAMEDARTPQ